MTRRQRTPISPEEQKANQAEELETALRVLSTPIGRALRKPGATFRYWSGSSPANVWVQTKSGRYAFHSEEGFGCPVKESFRNLRPFLRDADSSLGSGEQVFVLDEGLVTEFDRRRMDKRLPNPSAPRIKKPTSRF